MQVEPCAMRQACGQLVAEPQEVASVAVVDVHGLVSEVVALLAPQAAQRAVQVNVGPPAAARHVLADPLRLRQVLAKLLGNAIRHNREHGRVDVRLSLMDSSDVAIAVSDSGGGMSPGDVAKVFEPCELAAMGCAPQHGNAACLAIVRASARAMKGDVVAASAVGVGSTFVVCLPAAAMLDEIRDQCA